MANESNGGALIVGALMLAASILGSSYFIAQSIDRAADGLKRVAVEFEGVAGGDGRVAGEPSDAAARAEADRRYEIEIGQAPVKGAANAPITIVEWSDFQCPFCARVTPTLGQVEKEYGDKVRLVFKHMPLPMHPNAPGAHAAAEAAHRQGRFWEMHDRIFAAPNQLSSEQYVVYATELGLDLDQFKTDSSSAEVQARIAADVDQAAQVGVTGTPAFFINGRFLSGAQPFESFKRMIDEELRKDS